MADGGFEGKQIIFDQRLLWYKRHDVLETYCNDFAITNNISQWYLALEAMVGKVKPYLKTLDRRKYYNQALEDIYNDLHGADFVKLSMKNRTPMENEKYQEIFLKIRKALRKLQDDLSQDMAINHMELPMAKSINPGESVKKTE